MALVVVGLWLFSGCNGDEEKKTTSDPNIGKATLSSHDYTTVFREIASGETTHDEGGFIEVENSNSPLYGVKVSVPAKALPSNQTIVVSEIDNPPALPEGLNYVGMPVDLGPDGLSFSKKVTVELPYSGMELRDAGTSDEGMLKVFSYDKTREKWEEVDFTQLDRENNVITVEISHFSILAEAVFNATPPENLGIPQPGDLLYKTGLTGLDVSAKGWRPGHVGIYTGEKIYSGTGLASESVQVFGRYNVIETLGNGVQYSYYDIPNATETSEANLVPFQNTAVYMGAREPVGNTLTPGQRSAIVSYVEAQIGKKYAVLETIGSAFGFMPSDLVKGPDKFNCVGLAEKAYEMAGVNGGIGLFDGVNEEDILTPAEQYSKTKVANPIQPVKIKGITVGRMSSELGFYSIPFTVEFDILVGNRIDSTRCLKDGEWSHCGELWDYIPIRIPRGSGTSTYEVVDIFGNKDSFSFSFSWNCCDVGEGACWALGGGFHYCETEN